MKAKLTTAYVIGLAIIAILAGSTALWSYFAINSERDARLVAGAVSRLHRNSQEVIATAAAFRREFAGDGSAPAPQTSQIELQKARLAVLVREIGNDHQFFISRIFSGLGSVVAGDRSGGHSDPRIRQYLALDSEMQKFIQAANRLAGSAPYSMTAGDTSVEVLLEKSNFQITRLLRELQAEFVTKTRDRVMLLQRILVGSLAAIVLVAILEGLFLFRPLVAQAASERNQLERKTEELSKANKVKGEFLSNINHELRTPLSAISGLIEMTKSDAKLPAHLRQNLLQAEANTLRLKVLLDDILDLSKADLDELTVTERWFDLEPFLEELCTAYKVQAESRALSFRLISKSSLPESVLADKERVRQVLDHLLSNAFKFTREGSITVSTWHAKHDGTIHFEIKDTGSGISSDMRARLFNRFTPGNPEMNRGHAGTGVGLALAKIVAGKLGGDLMLKQSSKEKGTIFQFSFRPESASPETFNARDLSGNDTRERLPRTLKLANKLAGKRVLVVDDVEENRKILNHFLSRSGAALVSATNGKEAVDMVQKFPFDAVLMDIQMPLMDGYEATRLIRSRNSTLPIIAITAHGLQRERQKCIELGFTDYLVKPVDPMLLIDLIDRYTDNSAGDSSC